ncbi:MAG TPA: hypothetical protein VF490_21060 [Chryseosolibacter sp.]
MITAIQAGQERQNKNRPFDYFETVSDELLLLTAFMGRNVPMIRTIEIVEGKAGQSAAIDIDVPAYVQVKRSELR